MWKEFAGKSAPKPPRCPGCAQPMQLIRGTTRFGGLPDLFIFECGDCDERHIEEGDGDHKDRLFFAPQHPGVKATDRAISANCLTVMAASISCAGGDVAVFPRQEI